MRPKLPYMSSWATATSILFVLLAVQTPVGAQELEVKKLRMAGKDVPKFVVVHAFFGEIEDSLGGEDGVADPAGLDSLLRELGIEHLSATEAALLGAFEDLAERRRSLFEVPRPNPRREREAAERYAVESRIARMAALGDCYGNFLRAVSEISTPGRSAAIDRRIEAIFRSRVTLGGDGGPEVYKSLLESQEAFDQSMIEALAFESIGEH